ncbi:hypothetical protein [Microcoleus sp. herbarium14]|uniref:hypothetical protein n=1 Tax=Microcoleus sp. herbarium14 TaxID=3055439 RepID=UPI002FD42E8B
MRFAESGRTMGLELACARHPTTIGSLECSIDHQPDSDRQYPTIFDHLCRQSSYNYFMQVRPHSRSFRQRQR